ncbi:MAG: phosphotyrosine protein phosphatase [Hyphomonas sp.]|nr:phosphotyrosine protein phosphatase [Hyphomonas sp.]
MTDAQPMNVLFVCSRNKWRSPTAEQVFQKDPCLRVRSAGTSRTARRPITVADIRWADLVLVMEDKHKARLRAQFRDEVRYKTVHSLDIPDLYRYMDPDLIDLLKDKVTPLIAEV